MSIPTAASSPTSRTPIREPAGSTWSPSATSSPRRRMCWPDRAGRPSTVTSAEPRSVASYGTIASASSGTGAPVMIFMTVPGDSRCGAAPPAGDLTDDRQPDGADVGGVLRRRPPRTAYPSIAELSKRGRSRPRDDVLAEAEAERVEDVLAEGHQLLDAAEQVVAVLLEGAQPVRPGRRRFREHGDLGDVPQRLVVLLASEEGHARNPTAACAHAPGPAPGGVGSRRRVRGGPRGGRFPAPETRPT